MNLWHTTEEELPPTHKYEEYMASAWVIGRFGKKYMICRYWLEGKRKGWEANAIDWDDPEQIRTPDEWCAFEYKEEE
jgi:hypothetical protein